MAVANSTGRTSAARSSPSSGASKASSTRRGARRQAETPVAAEAPATASPPYPHAYLPPILGGPDFSGSMIAHILGVGAALGRLQNYIRDADDVQGTVIAVAMTEEEIRVLKSSCEETRTRLCDYIELFGELIANSEEAFKEIGDKDHAVQRIAVLVGAFGSLVREIDFAESYLHEAVPASSLPPATLITAREA